MKMRTQQSKNQWDTGKAVLRGKFIALQTYLKKKNHLKWKQTLPIALLQIRMALRNGLKLSPFEIIYGRPLQIPSLGMLPLDLEL